MRLTRRADSSSGWCKLSSLWLLRLLRLLRAHGTGKKLRAEIVCPGPSLRPSKHRFWRSAAACTRVVLGLFVPIRVPTMDGQRAPPIPRLLMLRVGRTNARGGESVCPKRRHLRRSGQTPQLRRQEQPSEHPNENAVTPCTEEPTGPSSPASPVPLLCGLTGPFSCRAYTHHWTEARKSALGGVRRGELALRGATREPVWESTLLNVPFWPGLHEGPKPPPP